jgi:hypothetical protein
MAYPQWITPAGQLGLIPEGKYLDLPLEVHDPAGSTLTYKFLSGALPGGVYVQSTGRLTGVPVITDVTTNLNLYYEFSVRVKNALGLIADRTFSLTVSNIIPPSIEPKITNLGNVFDGTYYSKQLYANEINPNATLTWTLESGHLPPGVSLSTAGLISGYIFPLAVEGSAGVTGYNRTRYNQYGYDNVGLYKSSSYKFTVKVFDGANYDQLTYTILVSAKSGFTADSTASTIDDTFLTVDTDNRYLPIVTTPPQELPTVRSNSNFAFRFTAVDPQNDVIYFGISSSGATGFDAAGFDSSGFDQGLLQLPPGLALDPVTGWLSGHIPTQPEASIDYSFIIYAYKRDYPTYSSLPVTFKFTVLGDITNTINWATDQNLGYIDNGAVSELSVVAVSAIGKTLVYTLNTDVSRLPQGLRLLPTGLIVGRCTFEYFSLDQGATTIDSITTNFDNIFTFTVTATANDASASSSKTFTVRINNFNKTPYENLYLEALPTLDQRLTFLSIVNNTDIFPENLIYRPSDPWFGRAGAIRSLFLPGLAPHALSSYVSAMSTNHFNKRIEFSNVKTARAVDANFNTKYEVVYIELTDDREDSGKTPADSTAVNYINFNKTTKQSQLTTYNIQPNSFENMQSVVEKALGYSNQGALPEWMTSPQDNYKTLGFVRAIVLAYTVPGASKLIAYRLKSNGIKFNSVDFVADRYELDNTLSVNFDTTSNRFTSGKETTFDTIARSGSDTIAYTVNYAITDFSYFMLNNQTVGLIQGIGGLDGARNFKDGDTLIFAQQQTYTGETHENDGWLTPDLAVIPGYVENLIDSAVPNQRAGIWQVKITPTTTPPASVSSFGGYYDSLTIGFDTVPFDDTIDIAPSDGIYRLVNLVYIAPVTTNQRVQVNSGRSYGGAILYYDPILSPTQTVPAYNRVVAGSLVSLTGTTFDSKNTKFISNRDSYSLPGTQYKYLKYTKTGVLN